MMIFFMGAYERDTYWDGNVHQAMGGRSLGQADNMQKSICDILSALCSYVAQMPRSPKALSWLIILSVL
jgi:hypothetical protein